MLREEALDITFVPMHRTHTLNMTSTPGSPAYMYREFPAVEKPKIEWRVVNAHVREFWEAFEDTEDPRSFLRFTRSLPPFILTDTRIPLYRLLIHLAKPRWRHQESLQQLVEAAMYAQKKCIPPPFEVGREVDLGPDVQKFWTTAKEAEWVAAFADYLRDMFIVRAATEIRAASLQT